MIELSTIMTALVCMVGFAILIKAELTLRQPTTAPDVPRIPKQSGSFELKLVTQVHATPGLVAEYLSSDKYSESKFDFGKSGQKLIATNNLCHFVIEPFQHKKGLRLSVVTKVKGEYDARRAIKEFSRLRNDLEAANVEVEAVLVTEKTELVLDISEAEY